MRLVALLSGAVLCGALSLQLDTAARPRHAALSAPSKLPFTRRNLASLDADAVFEIAVSHCEAAVGSPDARLSAEVPALLRHVFAADFSRLVRACDDGCSLVRNVTCMRPEEGAAASQLFDDELLRLPLRPGRACIGGACCDACSRILWPSLATPAPVIIPASSSTGLGSVTVGLSSFL